jgi:hypothetical protein
MKTYITNVGGVKITAHSYEEFQAKIAYALKCQHNYKALKDLEFKFTRGEKNA